MWKLVGCIPKVSDEHTAFSIEVESTSLQLVYFYVILLCPFTDVTWLSSVFRIIKCALLRKFCQTSGRRSDFTTATQYPLKQQQSLPITHATSYQKTISKKGQNNSPMLVYHFASSDDASWRSVPPDKRKEKRNKNMIVWRIIPRTSLVEIKLSQTL